MKICPRCGEWRTKTELKPMAVICQTCDDEVAKLFKKGNRDIPKTHIRNYGLPSK